MNWKGEACNMCYDLKKVALYSSQSSLTNQPKRTPQAYEKNSLQSLEREGFRADLDISEKLPEAVANPKTRPSFRVYWGKTKNARKSF